MLQRRGDSGRTAACDILEHSSAGAEQEEKELRAVPEEQGNRRHPQPQQAGLHLRLLPEPQEQGLHHSPLSL